jgi:hypothetical protein
MKHLKLILLATLSCFSAVSTSKPTPQKLNEVHPYSDTLHKDIERCLTHGCKPIYGTINGKLNFKDDRSETYEIQLDFEFCSASISASSFIFKNSKLLIQSKAPDLAKITCNNESSTYNRISLVDYDGLSGVSLREINGTYTHLGKLQMGIIFLPYSDN